MKSIEIPVLDYELAADWYAGNTDQIVLLLVGYSSNKGNYRSLASHINKETDSTVVVLDYSGHGDSPFELTKVTPAQNFLEVITVFDWLKTNHPGKKIGLLGNSYGGYMTLHLMMYRKFEKAVLTVPALYQPEEFYSPWSIRINYAERYRKNTDNYRKDLVRLQKTPVIEKIKDLDIKSLVIVHEKDEIVTTENTDTIIEALRANSYLAKGYTHSFPLDDAYKSKIIEFLK